MIVHPSPHPRPAHTPDARNIRALIAAAMLAFAAFASACFSGSEVRAGSATAPLDAGFADALPRSAALPGATATANHETDAATGGDAGTPCVAAALQPGNCVPHRATFEEQDDEALAAWVAKRTSAPAGAAVSLDAVPRGCEESAFGAAQERVLTCLMMQPVHVDPILRLDGPAQLNIWLRRYAARDKKLIELIALPFGVLSSNFGDPLFFGQYVLDDPAAALTLSVDQADCKAASERLGTYWNIKVAEAKRRPTQPAQLTLSLNAIKHEQRAGAAWIASICRAAGRYQARNGSRMVKVP